MAEKKFSELETAATLDGSEYAAVSQSQSGVLTSVKATLQAIANWIASGSRYASALNTQDKTLTGAINEVLADAGSDVSVTNTIPSSDETKRVATVTIDGTPTDINADDTEAILRRVFGEHIVEGNPVTFDAYLGVETVKSLTLTMNPIQDLHGYDSPWAGGSGKNKLQMTATSQTINGVTFAVNSDGSVLVNGTATDGDSRFTVGAYIAKAQSSQKLNGLPDSIINSDIILGYQGYGTVNTVSRELNINRSAETDWNNNVYITVKDGITANNLLFKPMIRLATETDASFAPYENICPISGRDSVDVVISDGETAQTKTIALPSTVYGGTDEVVGGVGQGEWGYIASYNGETLPSEWISDRDVYAPNTTPTTGAEVAYKLATPTTFSTTPTPIGLNKGNNVVSSDADELELKYSVG